MMPIGLRRHERDTGTHHGEMHKLVRNPFRSKFMKQNFDAAIATYDKRHRNFIHVSGHRCTGNSWATNFWRGYDLIELDYSGSKDTAAYAMYRAGQEVRRVVDRLKEEENWHADERSSHSRDTPQR